MSAFWDGFEKKALSKEVAGRAWDRASALLRRVGLKNKDAFHALRKARQERRFMNYWLKKHKHG